MSCCSTKTGGVTALVTGIILILLGSLGGFLGFPALFKSEVRKQAVLAEGTDTWKAWLEPPIKIYMNFTFFNVENPEEVAEGGKPKLREVGPFVYEEKLEKIIVDPATAQGTILYKEKTSWTFIPELTLPLNDTQTVTIINPVLTVAAAKLDSMKRSNILQEFVYWSAVNILSLYDEGLFVTRSVRELLFDGYDSRMLSHLKTVLGDQIPSGRFPGLVIKAQTLGSFLEGCINGLCGLDSNGTDLIEDILILYEDALLKLGVTITMTDSSGNFLFNGFALDPYLEAINGVCSELAFDIPTKLVCAALKKKIEDFLATNELLFGFFSSQNGTDEGIFEIESGKNGPETLGIIRGWKNSSVLDYWPDLDGTNSCNKMNGTDGTIFAPLTIGTDKEKRLYLFVTDLCRSLHMTYNEDVTHFGITTRRYTVPDDALASPADNPANMCYCDNPEDPTRCFGSVLPLASCQMGAPVVMSTPHFYMTTTEELKTDFEGIKAVKEIHETYLDLDPIISVPLSARKRIQLNMKVKKSYPLPSFAKLKKEYTFPIMWVEEGADFDQASADLLNNEIYGVISALDAVRWTLIGLGIAVTLPGCLLLVKAFKKSKETV